MQVRYIIGVISWSLWKGAHLIDNSKYLKWNIRVLIRNKAAQVQQKRNSNFEILLRCAVLFYKKYSLVAKNLH